MYAIHFYNHIASLDMKETTRPRRQLLRRRVLPLNMIHPPLTAVFVPPIKYKKEMFPADVVCQNKLIKSSYHKKLDNPLACYQVQVKPHKATHQMIETRLVESVPGTDPECYYFQLILQWDQAILTVMSHRSTGMVQPADDKFKQLSFSQKMAVMEKLQRGDGNEVRLLEREMQRNFRGKRGRRSVKIEAVSCHDSEEEVKEESEGMEEVMDYMEAATETTEQTFLAKLEE